MTNHISLFEELTNIGAGIFVRERNSWSRIHTKDKWRIYEGPIEIWFQNTELQDKKMELLISLLKSIRNLSVIKFNKTKIQEGYLKQIKELWPSASIEIT